MVTFWLAANLHCLLLSRSTHKDVLQEYVANGQRNPKNLYTFLFIYFVAIKEGLIFKLEMMQIFC